MTANIKFALATIPVGAFVIYHAFFILSFDKRIGELEESVREMRREIQRSESAVALNTWPEGESVIWTNNTIWYPPTFGRAVDGILFWTSELSASIAKP